MKTKRINGRGLKEGFEALSCTIQNKNKRRIKEDCVAETALAIPSKHPHFDQLWEASILACVYAAGMLSRVSKISAAAAP
jgi:hypothetical protein